jgi:hypothetical protein
MRVAGVTVPLATMQAQQIGAVLEPYTGSDPWRGSPRLSISGFGSDPVPARAVDQTIVVEVQADTAFDRGRWRHPTRYMRNRPELSVGDLAPLPESAA